MTGNGADPCGARDEKGEQAMPDVAISPEKKLKAGRRKRQADIGAEVMHKHSVVLSGHRTSVSLESIFWHALREIAEARGLSVNRLVETIDAGRTTNLSSAIRVFVLQNYKAAARGDD
jgi:predicted DNA-binding ribbon-helix-helix protein